MRNVLKSNHSIIHNFADKIGGLLNLDEEQRKLDHAITLFYTLSGVTNLR